MIDRAVDGANEDATPDRRAAAAPPALTLEAVTVVLDGRVVLREVSLTFAAGRAHAIVGRSGAGKSVLMKAACGLLPLARGAVRVHAPPLVFVHQDPALLDTLDVEENVAFPALRSPTGRRDGAAQVAARIEAALAALDLLGVRRRMPESLGVVLQKRVALARALALAPGVLVVDEPTTGLDPISAAGVDEALAALVEAGTTPIVITHSPRTLARLTPEIVVVEGGTARPRATAPSDGEPLRRTPERDTKRPS